MAEGVSSQIGTLTELRLWLEAILEVGAHLVVVEYGTELWCEGNGGLE